MCEIRKHTHVHKHADIYISYMMKLNAAFALTEWMNGLD